MLKKSITENLYTQHIAALARRTDDVLEQNRIDSLLLHSGNETHYFGDDRGIPFQSYGHFCHWLPLNTPDQFIWLRSGQKPTYLQVIPCDFWHEHNINFPELLETGISNQFLVKTVSSSEQVFQAIERKNCAYLGPDSEFAAANGIDKKNINPREIITYFDFYRGIKTEYEIENLREANRIALLGHESSRQSFLEGKSEYEIHFAFLKACNQLENESPYTNIVALNEKAAILHYQNKRKQRLEHSSVLLIDAGAKIHGYGSDITRTWSSSSCPVLFSNLINSITAIKDEIVSKVKPRINYQALHQTSLKLIANLLKESQICSGSLDEIIEKKIANLFMPHGIGHLLGIQVHDVAGHQQNTKGTALRPPADSPMLRCTRDLVPNMTFTIEPGLYFIPVILEQERKTDRGKNINWSLIDELTPFGGIRIEDNVRVTETGFENLTT
jgi:Xaa-Pro dipeptidase